MKSVAVAKPDVAVEFVAPPEAFVAVESVACLQEPPVPFVVVVVVPAFVASSPVLPVAFVAAVVVVGLLVVAVEFVAPA